MECEGYRKKCPDPMEMLGKCIFFFRLDQSPMFIRNTYEVT